MSTNHARYCFAGGGTGGHLYPGLAVAHALRGLEPQAEITFFTTTRALDRDLLSRTNFQQIEQAVRPVSLRPWHWPAFWLAWRKSVAAAVASFRAHPPRAVLGLGGYAAGPPVVAARRLGIRTAILNPDAIPGRANRFLARHCDMVVLQWDASRKHLPAAANCRALGCPIRPEFGQLAADVSAGKARQHFGLAPDRPTLLATGASQGARTLNQAVQAIWPAFFRERPNWQLLHLTGKADEADARAAYAAAGAAGAKTHVLAFTHEMWHAIAAADLVISRAGASTLAELTALGKPSILLPYPYHRDRHQHANAQVLVDAGAAVMIEDTKKTTETSGPLLAALQLLAKPAAGGAMAKAAASLGRPDAAKTVAQWLRGGSA